MIGTDRGPRDIFLESLGRCEQRSFVDRFYERFLASSPEVREKFQFTDFRRQRRMLMRSLELIAMAAGGAPEGLKELHARAETHARGKLNIEPRFYDLWLEAALSAARDSDSEWTDQIESAWRTILGLAVRHMTRRYDA